MSGCYTCSILYDRLLSASIRFYDLEGKMNIAMLLHDDDSAMKLCDEISECMDERKKMKVIQAVHMKQAHPKEVAATHGGSL